MFWVGIALGCLGLTMLHHLVGGSWGLVVRRPMESGGMTLLPLAFLFLPLALGLPRLYPWARPEEVAHDPVLQHKSLYLNVGFFLVRTVVYFVIWFVLRFVLDRPVRAQDRRDDHRPEPLAAVAQRAGAGLAVPDRDIRGDRLDDVAGATLVLDDLRLPGDRGRGAGDAWR